MRIFNRNDEANEIVNLVKATNRHQKRKLVTGPAARHVSNFWEVRSMVKAVADDPVLSVLSAWKPATRVVVGGHIGERIEILFQGLAKLES